jgi:hypothetical protein
VIDGLTLEGQYWGGNPLHDARGEAQPPTFTNLTVQNIYRGEFMTNTLIAARGGGMTIDGFDIDMEPPADKQSDGPSVGIFAVEDRGNEFKNGTIHLNDEKGSKLFEQRSLVTDGSGVEGPTLLKNITIVDHGSAGSIYQTQRSTRDFRMENVTYELAEGVDNTKRDKKLMGVSLRVPASNEITPPHAYRTFHKNFVYEREFDETFSGSSAADNDSVFPQDVFFVGGSIANNPEFSRFVKIFNINFGTRFETVKNLRYYVNDFTFTSHTSTGPDGAEWHKQFSPESEKLPGPDGTAASSASGVVRFRNCTDHSGRKSDNSGTYTATSTDESNGYVLIPTNLLSRAWERSVTANADYNVTSVEVANQDGTIRGKIGGNQLEPYLKVSVDGTITQGDTFGWTARVTPLDAYSTTGLFVARLIENKSLTSGSGPWTHDLRGTAATQESRDPIVYTASSDDTSVVTANVQDDDYTLELTEQGTGTATITVTGEIPGVGTTTESFDVTINQ